MHLWAWHCSLQCRYLPNRKRLSMYIPVSYTHLKEDALKKFGERGETYKCELISELEDGHITTYTQGAFTDLCRGPHSTSTAPIKALKLLSVAGAYRRGQEDRKHMTRIYGITFPKKKMLDE